MNTKQINGNRQQSHLPDPGPVWLALMLSAFVSLSFISTVVFAQSADDSPPERRLLIANSNNESLNQRLRSLIQDELGPQVAIGVAKTETMAPDLETPVVAIGPRAFQSVIRNNPKRPVLALFVNETFVDEAREKTSDTVSSVLSDPILRRQVATGKTILPHATRVSMLARPDSTHLYEKILQDLPNFGLEGKIFLVSSEERLIPTLIRALKYGDFILAAPDNTIYNPRTIKHILLTAYRRNRIVIGPSQAYVKAGSLASTFTPLSDIARLSAEFLDHYWLHGRFPEPKHPTEFGIEVNLQVGRSLNIPLPDRQVLLEKVQKRLSTEEDNADE